MIINGENQPIPNRQFIRESSSVVGHWLALVGNLHAIRRRATASGSLGRGDDFLMNLGFTEDPLRVLYTIDHRQK